MRKRGTSGAPEGKCTRARTASQRTVSVTVGAGGWWAAGCTAQRRWSSRSPPCLLSTVPAGCRGPIRVEAATAGGNRISHSPFIGREDRRQGCPVRGPPSETYDPRYHQPCDNLTGDNSDEALYDALDDSYRNRLTGNVNRTALDVTSDALAP